MIIDGTFLPGTNEYTADIESWVGLANAYIDLGTYHCLTPYVGGGVGFASISVLGLKDVNVPNNSVFYGTDNTETNFAWAVYAGLAYDVTPGLTIDLSYRYTDLGDASSGRVTGLRQFELLQEPRTSTTSPPTTSCSASAGSSARASADAGRFQIRTHPTTQDCQPPAARPSTGGFFLRLGAHPAHLTSLAAERMGNGL